MNREHLKQIIKEELRKHLNEAIPSWMTASPQQQPAKGIPSGRDEGDVPTAQTAEGAKTGLDQLAKALNGKAISVQGVGNFPISAKLGVFTKKGIPMMGTKDSEEAIAEITILTGNNKNLVMKVEIRGIGTKLPQVWMLPMKYEGHDISNPPQENLGNGVVNSSWANKIIGAISQFMVSKGYAKEMRPPQQ